MRSFGAGGRSTSAGKSYVQYEIVGGGAGARASKDGASGTTVNQNPQVQFSLTVTIPGRDPYQATLTQVVSRLVMGNFQPGSTVPVRVSPEDPQSLIIA